MPYRRIEISAKWRGKNTEQPYIHNPESAAHVINKILNRHTILWVEEVLMLCLSCSNMLIGWHQVSKGGTDGAIVDVRAVATVAVHCCAAKVILAHNHPGQSLKPSENDIQITRQVKAGLCLLGIDLTDHLIITEQDYLSMSRNGLI